MLRERRNQRAKGRGEAGECRRWPIVQVLQVEDGEVAREIGVEIGAAQEMGLDDFHMVFWTVVMSRTASEREPGWGFSSASTWKRRPAGRRWRRMLESCGCSGSSTSFMLVTISRASMRVT